MAKKEGKKALNPKCDVPVSKKEITKDFILHYTAEKGTPEQKAELKKFILAHTVSRKKPVGDGEYVDIDLAKVRAKFCEMFFPELNKKKSPTKKKETFIDMVERLL